MTIPSWPNRMNRVQSSPRITVSTSFSWKDLDNDEPVVNESTEECHSTQKDVEENLPQEKSKKSQGKRKASFASEPATKKLKWSWTSEAVETPLKYTKEFKTKCDFNAMDFEADQSTMCAQIRRWMLVTTYNTIPDNHWKEKHLPSIKQKEITETRRKGVVHTYLPSNLQGGWINLQLSPNLQLGKDLKETKWNKTKLK